MGGGGVGMFRGHGDERCGGGFSQRALAEEIEAVRAWAGTMFAQPGTEAQPRNAKTVQHHRYLDESALSSKGEPRPSLPISFVYDGKQCDGFLATWNHTVTDTAVRNGVRRRTVSCDDPNTGLRIECEVTTYADLPAVDWVLSLTNQGVKDTPLIEQFMPLSATLLPGEGPITLRWSNGDGTRKMLFCRTRSLCNMEGVCGFVLLADGHRMAVSPFST